MARQTGFVAPAKINPSIDEKSQRTSHHFGQTRMTPKISIVMPCFNAERHLSTSWKSLFAQTFQDWELIAVDDGSSDGTLSWLKSHKDDRTKIISQPNQGVSAARNAGLAQCEGDFVAFLDADDTWDAGFLASMYAVLANRADAVLAYCGWKNVGLQGVRGEPFVPPEYEGSNKAELMLEVCRWPIHGCLTRRTAIETAGGFDTQLRIGEDYLLWMEVAIMGAIIRVPKVLAYYHHHDGIQATHNIALSALDTLKAKHIFLHKYPEQAKKIGPSRIEAFTWGRLMIQANTLYWNGNLEAARPLFRALLKHGYGAPKDILRMLPSLLPLAIHKAIARTPS